MYVCQRASVHHLLCIKHKFTKGKTHALCYRFRGNFRNFKTHVKFGKFDSNFVKGALVPLVSTYPPLGVGGCPGIIGI